MYIYTILYFLIIKSILYFYTDEDLRNAAKHSAFGAFGAFGNGTDLHRRFAF
jgi:hypothetical protein